MALRSLFTRARSNLREFGWRVGFALAAHRLLGRIGPRCGLYWYQFYRQPLCGAPTLRNSSAITFRWLDQYEHLLDVLPRPLPDVKARFEQRVECLVALKEGELVACAWFGFEKFEEDEVRCTFLLPRQTVWDFDIFVFPPYRIGRLFIRTWQEANRKLTGEGFSESLSRISAYNRNSILSHKKLGAQKVGTAVFLKFGGAQVMVASLRPYVSVTFQKGQQPCIDFGNLAQR